MRVLGTGTAPPASAPDENDRRPGGTTVVRCVGAGPTGGQAVASCCAAGAKKSA